MPRSWEVYWKIYKDKLWQVSQKVNSDYTWHHFRQNVDVKGWLHVALCISLSTACSSFRLFSDYRLSLQTGLNREKQHLFWVTQNVRRLYFPPTPEEVRNNFLNLNALKYNWLIENKCLIVKFYFFSWKKKKSNNKTKCVLNAIFCCTD